MPALVSVEKPVLPFRRFPGDARRAFTITARMPVGTGYGRWATRPRRAGLEEVSKS